MKLVTLVIGVLAALVCSAFVWGVEQLDGNILVRAELLIEHEIALPGEDTTLGIQLQMESGWHTYWQNSGDSGLPISVTLETVEGLEFGKMQWPAPDWYLGAGDVLDYVYEGTIVLLVPVSISPEYSGDGSVNIRGRVDWLVCKDVCLPGSADISGKLEIGGASTRSGVADAIDVARREIPVEIGAGTSDVRLGWRGSVLEVRCPGADAITLFPHYSEETEPVGPYKLRSVEKDTLFLPFDPPPDQYLSVSGVVTVDRGQERSSYSFAIPGPTLR